MGESDVLSVALTAAGYVTLPTRGLLPSSHFYTSACVNPKHLYHKYFFYGLATVPATLLPSQFMTSKPSISPWISISLGLRVILIEDDFRAITYLHHLRHSDGHAQTT